MSAALALSFAAVALGVHPMSVPVSRRSALVCGAAAAATISLEPAPPALAAVAPAVVAQRFSFQSTISPLPPFGALSSFEDELTTPKGSKNPSVRVRFEFPSQWSQIDKALGGITLVDGNTGLKCYVLRASLPEGETLASVPKAWFGETIFDEKGAIVRGGTGIDTFKVTSSKMIDSPPGAAPSRRRIGLKYTVVTGNQKTVDRRAVVDAYEAGGAAFMLLASATSTKWESAEKERCERTAESFFIGL